MKNLYLRLGIEPNSSPEEIEAALQANPELGSAAPILLDESRRSAYNRTVSTLRSIGTLRDRLGLDADLTWFVKTCPDFAPRSLMRKFQAPISDAAESAAAETNSTSSSKSEIPAPGNRNYQPWIKAAVIIFAIAVALALWRVFAE